MPLRALVSRLSISTRLTLWFGTSLLVLLSLFVAGLYGSVHLGLHDDLEARLHEEAAAVRAHLRAHGGASPARSAAGGHPVQAASGTFVRLLGPEGQVVQESPSFRARPALAVDLPPSAAPSLTARTWGGTAAKSLYVPLDTESPTVAWLEVTKLQSPIHRQLHALRWWLVLGILGGVGIAMLVGYGLARRALRPVAALTAAAQEMQDEPTGTLPTDFGGEDELTELADTFNGLIERLRASLQRERRFRADAAHNMFTPLTALQSELDVTLRHPRSDTEYRAALRTVRRHTETISSLLEELMTLSRIEGRTEPPGPAPTNATACLRRRVERVRARAKAQEITLDWQAPDALEVPVADDDLTLIADHLLDNALKYTPEGGIVQVAVHASNSDVVIRVSDDGIGIDADGADRLFDRFYRHADAEEAAPGGGLGLSIVQAVVRSYDGSISVQSPGPGEGSTFTVRLPQ